jgi:hypothetical protein
MESDGNNETIIKTRCSDKGNPAWVPLKLQQKQARKVMLDQAVEIYMHAPNSHNGKNVPPSTFSQIQQTFGNPSWMNRHSIFNHF